MPGSFSKSLAGLLRLLCLFLGLLFLCHINIVLEC